MREIGKQRGGFVVGVGHDKHYARHDSGLLDRFERVGKRLAASRRRRFLLRCERQRDEHCEHREFEPAFHHILGLFLRAPLLMRRTATDADSAPGSYKYRCPGRSRRFRRGRISIPWNKTAPPSPESTARPAKDRATS